jgi:hypothetical protein
MPPKFAWARARLLSADASVEDRKQAFEICEHEIRLGLQTADPRVIDDLHGIFFGSILQIPYFQDPTLLTHIFKSQVNLAFYCYPTLDPDFFSLDPNSILSSEDTILGGFLTALGRAFADHSYLGPIVVYDFPAITQSMVQDGSQSKIFFTLSSRLENRHPAILEAFAEVPRWMDRQVLLNVGFIGLVCKLLSVDQESPAVLSLLIESAKLFQWEETVCMTFFAKVYAYQWFPQFLEVKPVEYLQKWFTALYEAGTDKPDAEMVHRLEEFLNDPFSVHDLHQFWAVTSHSGCRRCVEVAASAVNRFLDEPNLHFDFFEYILSVLLALFEVYPKVSKPDEDQQYDQLFLRSVGFGDAAARVVRFCSFLFTLATREKRKNSIRFTDNHWLECLFAVLHSLVGINPESDDSVQAFILAGKLLHIAPAKFLRFTADKDSIKHCRERLCLVTSKVVTELCQFLISHGLVNDDITAVVRDLSEDCGCFITSSPDFDAHILQFAIAPVIWPIEIAFAFVQSGYLPSAKKVLFDAIAQIEFQSSEQLIVILNLLACIWEPCLSKNPPKTPKQKRCKRLSIFSEPPELQDELMRYSGHKRKWRDPDDPPIENKPPSEVIPIEILVFFRTLWEQELVTQNVMIPFVQAAVILTHGQGMPLWLPLLSQVTMCSAVWKSILQSTPSPEMRIAFCAYLMEMKDSEFWMTQPQEMQIIITHLLSEDGITVKVADVDCREVLLARYQTIIGNPLCLMTHGAYDKFPIQTFDEIYRAIQHHCDDPSDLEMFIECAAKTFQTLLVLIHHGCGAFSLSIAVWTTFAKFHKFLFTKVGVEFPWKVHFPPQFAAVPVRYQEWLCCPDAVGKESLKNFAHLLIEFEHWVHKFHDRSHIFYE